MSNFHRLTPNNSRSLGFSLLAAAITSLLGVQPAIAQPIFENITIAPGADAQTLRGISGGKLRARDAINRMETDTGPCEGYVDQEPDHTMTLTSFFNFLSLTVESPEDTTLLVVGPGGSWCNDDYQDKNPGLTGQWLEGSYDIWVGSYDREKYHPYVIRIVPGK